MASREEFENHCWQDLLTPESREVYSAYVRETYVGKKPALLAIDLYNLVYKGGARPPHEISRDFPATCGIYAHNAMAPTVQLIAACRAAGIPIIYIKATYSQNRVKSTHRKLPPVTAQDYEIHDAFAPEPSDLVFTKERASAFYGTPIMAHLTRMGVDSLIVCGESTSGCVRASVVDAYSNGFHISIVEECVFDRHELSHKVNLFDLHHKYADVMILDEVLTHIGRIHAH